MLAVINTQKAVYNLLSTNTVLQEATEGVYDHVLQKAQKPYLTIGDISASLDASPSYDDFLIELEINIYAENYGRKTVLEIAEVVYDALHRQAVTVEGFEQINSYITSFDTALNDDGKVYKANMVFEMLVRKTIG
jgi:hypothetical protein